ncbi:Uncharacterised protein [Mycobacteroides abscessus subsp. abscessus]|nr:Uncharacterised protein [Mycobacteroides abscessus subsp. abscessus]
MDRVVIARDHRERTHIGGREDLDITTATTRGVHLMLGERATSPHRVGELGGSVAAQDGEPLLQSGQHGAIGCRHGDVNWDNPAHLGVDSRGSRCGDGQFGTLRRQISHQVSGVIQMYEREQTLDHTGAVRCLRVADGGEDRGPAQSDQRVRHDGRSGSQRCRKHRGDAGVVCDAFRIPVRDNACDAILHRRKAFRSIGAPGHREHGPHGGGCGFGGHHRGAAVASGGGQSQIDVDPCSGQRHAQSDDAVGL